MIIWKLHNASDLQNPPYAVFTTSICSIPLQQCCKPPYASPPVTHATLQYKLPQKNENNYNELFISILEHLFLINLNINCDYTVKIIETDTNRQIKF
jgi:hypothetical protein